MAMVLAPSLAIAACTEAAPTVQEIPLEPAAWSMEVAGEPRVAESIDGTIALALKSERALLVVDRQGVAIDSIGREGEGPGEFRLLGDVFALADGRFAVVDPIVRRVTLLSRDGAEMELVALPPAHDASTLRITPSGTWASQRTAEGAEDSVTLVVSRPPHAAVTPVARIHVPVARFVPLGDIVLNTAPEYAARDAWGFSGDGLWIVRGADNRVEVMGEDGQVTSSPAVPFARIETVGADRDRWRGFPAPEAFRVEARPLAPLKGPFQEAVAAADGTLWLWLNQPAGHARELYAMRRFDSAELLRISLPNAHKIVGVGARYLFVYGETEDAVTLSAHPRPAVGTVVGANGANGATR